MKPELDFLEQYIDERVPRLLDIGCGIGYYTKRLSKLALNVDAIDICPKNIVKAYRKNCEPNIAYIIGDFPSYQTKNFIDKFRLITFINSLQTMTERDVRTSLNKAILLLRDNGMLYLTVDHTEPNTSELDLNETIPMWLSGMGLELVDCYDDNTNTFWLWQK